MPKNITHNYSISVVEIGLISKISVSNFYNFKELK